MPRVRPAQAGHQQRVVAHRRVAPGALLGLLDALQQVHRVRQKRPDGVQLHDAHVVQPDHFALAFEEHVRRGAQLGAPNVPDVLDQRLDLVRLRHVLGGRVQDQLGLHHVVLAGHFGEVPETLIT